MRRLTLWVPCAALWVGCNTLLGIEEAEVIDGIGGSAGSAGSDAAAGGSAGEAGTAGSAGAGASSGASGSAGADAGCSDVLNDQKNCGWCGHDCGAAPCLQGYCQPEELSAIDWAYDFAISADSIFIAGGVDYFFYKLPKAGGAYEKWTGASDVLPMTLRDSYVYFGEYDAHVLWRASTAGTLAPTKLLTANAPIESVLVEATGIYYYEYGLQRIRRASLAGTGSVDFATNIYNAWWLVSDATHIYAGSVLDGIYRFDKNATTPIVVDDSYFFHDIPGPGPAALTIDDKAVYFSTGDPVESLTQQTSSLIRYSKDKSSQKNLATSNTLVFDIASDGTHAYWVEIGTVQQDYGNGAVRGIESENTLAQLRTYAVNQRFPMAVAVDGEYLYWLNGGWTNLPGGVRRVRR